MATCEHCCGADQLFDGKTAKRDFNSYIKKGPKKVTSKLIEFLSVFNLDQASLLDIGGGIGAIQWHVLKNNGSKTTDVDASSSYLAKAKEYAVANEWMDKAYFIQGDFVDFANNLSEHDFVSLDKVVCCYPHYEEILIRATEKCKKAIVLSYPMNGIIADVFRFFGVVYMKLINNPFKPYVHNPKNIEDLIISRGFVKSRSSVVFPWHVQLYERV